MLKKIVIDKANRLFQLPPHIFSFIEDIPKKKLMTNIETVDIGSFTWPVPFEADAKLTVSDLAPASEITILELKELIAEWAEKEYHVKLNPLKEVFIGNGISAMFNQLAAAFIDPGDIVFVPELSLPLYKKAVTAVGGEILQYEINRKKNWQPNFEKVESKLGRVSRMLIINSPHNPTGGVIEEADLEHLVWLASKENIILINDAAYQSLSDTKRPSLMQIPQAKKVGAEFYSFAYNFGLPALPFGFAIGNKDIIHGLKQAEKIHKGFIPSYYVQLGKGAINRYPDPHLPRVRKRIKQAATHLSPLLDLLQLEATSIDSTPFVWAKIERRKSSLNLATQLYRRSRILIAPGNAFGDSGEGYIRFSLTADEATYKDAYNRINKKIRFFKTAGDDE